MHTRPVLHPVEEVRGSAREVQLEDKDADSYVLPTTCTSQANRVNIPPLPGI